MRAKNWEMTTQISTMPLTLERKHYLPQCRVILHKLVPGGNGDGGVAGDANARAAHVGVKNVARADAAANGHVADVDANYCWQKDLNLL